MPSTPKMPTLPEINFVPYSTEIALLPLPTCALLPYPMFQPESRTLAALWFIITWPIFITWLIAKVCFKEPTRADDEEVVLDKPEVDAVREPEVVHEPEPDAVPLRVPMDLSEPICELLRKKSYTVRELLLELRNVDPTITKHDVNSCLYSLGAKSITTSVPGPKKLPVWSLVEQKPKKLPKSYAPPSAAARTTTFTLEQLAEFHELEDPEYGVNCRGDVANTEGEYAGHFDLKTRIYDPLATQPADWETIMASL